MGSLRIAAALLALVVYTGGSAAARTVGLAPASVSTEPSLAHGLAHRRRPNFARFVVHDPWLRPVSHGSTVSGLRWYRTLHGPKVAGYLETSEAVAGRCGPKIYTAVPLDSGSVGGFAGWLIYKPGSKRHVAVVQASQALVFNRGRIRATSFIYDPVRDSSSSQVRVDVWACHPQGLHHVQTRVLSIR